MFCLNFPRPAGWGLFMTRILSMYRSGWRPTLADKIASITDPQELDGMAAQMAKTGHDTSENKALIATRRAELAKEGIK